MEQYLNVVTHTKGLDDHVSRDLLPIQQQLVNALLRARVVALSQEQHFFEIARRIRIRKITFYGIWGKWYAWGRHHPVLAELRDGAPLLHMIFKDDKLISRQLAQEWQAAERALVQRGNRDDSRPLQTFQGIAERLCQIKTEAAKLDAALALLMAWQAAENTHAHEQDNYKLKAVAFLLALVQLVKDSISYLPIIRWIQVTVADILFKKGSNHAYEMYKEVKDGKFFDEIHYRSLGQIACIEFQKEEYELVISNVTQALKFYRNQIDVDTEVIGHLIFVLFQSRLAKKQWKEIGQEKDLVDFFCEADGGNSAELEFVKNMFKALKDYDIKLYELTVRDYDRHNPMTDEQISIILLAKERITSKTLLPKTLKFL
ncbi:hypothetical protein INT45_002152 [Circinella minor]|uniref:Uncharacterized protein n=1 Tax=Circinella minor TaxID=1195481 RepID=A0A8H7SEG1_9FUNG|nr:hypothetical protein INT45_002152 [Circinella minor]